MGLYHPYCPEGPILTATIVEKKGEIVLQREGWGGKKKVTKAISKIERAPKEKG